MIMKKVFNSLFVIIAAMVTFAGCAKQEIDAPATPETKTVQFFANSIETKTVFGTPKDNTYPTLWENDDRVKIFVNLNTVTGVKTEDVVSVTPSDDFKEATFKSTEIGDSGIQDYTFYAVCPSDAYQPNSRNSETSTFTVMIPQKQKPTGDSVDSNAQVVYAVSENYRQPHMPTNVDLDFQHFSAYCKLSFSGLSEELGKIAQVTLESEVDLAGKWHVNVGEGEPTVADGSKKIIITTDKSENIWIACAPADVRGKKIKFIIDAMDGSSVSREVTFPNEDKYQFKSSRIANLTIDMTEVELEKPTVDKCFEKVTSAPSDWTGTYLIVYEGGKVAFDGNLAKLDAASNTIPVTITDKKIVYTETLMKSTFAIAKNGDSYSIKSASGQYIGNDSNSNSLTSSISALNNSLSFKSENEIDVISYGGAYLRYNATSGQDRFRYFKSGTYTGQKAIQLYKLVGDEPEGGEGGETPEDPETPAEPIKLSTPVVKCSDSDITENSLKFTWNEVANASNYEVTFNNGTTTTTTNTFYEATGLIANTIYSISVKAIGDSVNYTTSEAGTATGTTKEAQQSGGGDQPVEVVTYQHIITKKPSTGSVTLSDVIWTLDATNLNNYNSQNYAGVQFGTNSKTGTIKLTSENPFTYDGKSNVKEIRLWLNNGSGTITPKVTINGVECTMTGTIVKNSSAGSDYTKASLVKFTPTQPISGVVVIDLSCNKAGYFCAMEIDVQ